MYAGLQGEDLQVLNKYSRVRIQLFSDARTYNILSYQVLSALWVFVTTAQYISELPSVPALVPCLPKDPKGGTPS